MIRLILICALAVTSFGQWFYYPTPGAPRTPDGKLDLNAPAPRTAGGKPDFTGIWLNMQTLPCPVHMQDDRGECIEKTGLPIQAPNFAAELPGGLPYQPWAAELVQQRRNEIDQHVYCLPAFYPRAYGLPHITKTVQTADLLLMLNEFNAAYRQIFLDGRPLPEDPQPGWNGYSTARWEDDTLIVETIGFRDDLWLDMRGNPLTESAKVIERMRRPNYGTIEIDVTIDDPKAYTRPWTVPIKLTAVPDTELVDEICLENEKSVQHLPGK
jgi:hypothetical protein